MRICGELHQGKQAGACLIGVLLDSICDYETLCGLFSLEISTSKASHHFCGPLEALLPVAPS
jgi:hypothetical protein